MGGIRRRKKHAGHGGGNKNKREAGQPGNYKDIVRENEMYSRSGMALCNNRFFRS